MKIDGKPAREMKVREAFVMAAMQGLCANGDARNLGKEWLSDMAVNVADETIKKMDK